MLKSKMSRIVVLGIVVVAGIWMLIEPAEPSPENLRHQQAIQLLAPGGSQGNSGVMDITGVNAEPTTLPPVNSVPVNFSEIETTLENPNSMYNRWLRGEIDLDTEIGFYNELEIAVLRKESLNLLPDPTVQMAPQSLTPSAPILGTGFPSLDYNQSGGGFVPPDPELAVGPNHMIAVVNVAVEMYDKSGTSVFGPTTAGSLFTISPCTSGLYDPNVLYDEEADRWFLAYDQGARATTGGYCVLASQTSDPTGIWNQYFFPLNTASEWLDYPHAGVGDEYITMGGNMFSYAGGFVESRAWAWLKSDLYAGNAVTSVQTSLASIFTVQPLNLHGYSTNTWPLHGNDVYILGDLFNGSNYRIFRWTVPTNTLNTVGTVSLGSGGFPIDAPQGGSGSVIQANDWRALDFEYRNGYGWTAMTVACNPGSGTVNCIRWAQIDLANATLGPAGSSTYSSNGDYRFFPDVAVNHCNDMAIGYTKSNTSIFPEVWVTGRAGADPANTLQAETRVKAGEIVYTAFDSPPHRWGDYTGMTIDPDGKTFWYLGEYSKNTGTINGRWGTWINAFTYPDCGSSIPIIDVNPASTSSTQPVNTQVMQTLTINNIGSANLNWTITEDNLTTNSVTLIDSESPTELARIVQSIDEPIVLSSENVPFDQAKTLQFSLTLPGLIAAPVNLVLDDGSPDTAIGIGGSFIWLNRFTPSPIEFPFDLTQIHVAFLGGAGVDVGEQINLYVYEDTDGDGDPSNATLAAAYSAPVVALNAFNVYTLPTPLALNGPGDVLIGVFNVTAGTNAGEFPAVLDETTSQQRSWIGWNGNPADLSTLGTLALIDSFGFPGNWLVRGLGESGPPPDIVCDSPVEIPWASVNPSSGATSPSGSDLVDISFDSTGLAVGTYDATLCVDSNDPITPRIQVPLSLIVEPCVAPGNVSDLNASYLGGNIIRLDWTAVLGANQYEVWSAIDSPYFDPSGGDCNNPAPYACSLETTNVFQAAHLGNPGENYSYVVLASHSCGATTTILSNRTGEFDFSLVPGST